MRVRNLIIPVLTAVIALTGCGSSPDCSDAQDVQQALLGPELQKFVVPDGSEPIGNHSVDRLRCADGLTSTEVGATGTQTDPTSSYKLTEVMGKSKNFPYESSQTGVTITAQPPANNQVASAIVHTSGSSDQELHLTIGANGFYEASIKTAQYAYLADFPEDYPVSSITFCISPKKVG